MRAHDAGLVPGQKVVASPQVPCGVGGKTGVVVGLDKDGVLVHWEGLERPSKHEVSVIEVLKRDPDMERQARAVEAARKKRKLEMMPEAVLWTSACEVWTLENVVDEVRSFLYNLHVTCGSEHEHLRIGADGLGAVSLLASRDLKAAGRRWSLGVGGEGQRMRASASVLWLPRASGRNPPCLPEAGDLAFVPFSDRVVSSGQGFARVTSEAATVRLSYGSADAEHLSLELSPLRLTDPDDVSKGHACSEWGVMQESVPCLSPFWLSVSQSIDEHQFEDLSKREEGGGELRVRVTSVDATMKVAFVKTSSSSIGLGCLKKCKRPFKKTLDVPIITNVTDVEAGTPLYLVM